MDNVIEEASGTGRNWVINVDPKWWNKIKKG